MRILMMMMEGRGGMYQYGVLLSNALVREHEVHAIVPESAEVGFFEPGVHVVPFPVGDTKQNFLRRFVRPDRMVRLARTISRIHPDIVHFHNPYNPWPTPLLPWLRRYKTVTTIPEGRLHRGMHLRVEMMLSRMLHILFSERLIVLFERDRELLGRQALGKKTVIIPHGANTLFAKLADSNIAERDEVLFFGAALPFKGLEYLLKAFSIVAERVPGVNLVVASRLDADKFGSLIEALGNRVEVDNRFIPPEIAAEYFRRAKLVVLPYIEDDHSGLVPLVYSFGKPVVVTRLVSDMVEDGKTGLIVPPRDHLQLAEAIISLLGDDGLRSEMKLNIKHKIEGELSWDRVARETLQLYQAMLGNHPR